VKPLQTLAVAHSHPVSAQASAAWHQSTQNADTVALQVSSKRVIDGVPMHLKHYLLQQFTTELSDLPAKLAAGMSSLGASDAASLSAAAEACTAGSGVTANGAASGGKGKGKGKGGVHGPKGLAVMGGPGSSQAGGGHSGVLDAAKLMAEDESTAERRAQLHRQREQLLGVKMILSVF
jgi:hypothetical protein